MFTIILSSIVLWECEVNKAADPQRRLFVAIIPPKLSDFWIPACSSFGEALILQGDDRAGSVENVIGARGHQPSIG